MVNLVRIVAAIEHNLAVDFQHFAQRLAVFPLGGPLAPVWLTPARIDKLNLLGLDASLKHQNLELWLLLLLRR